MLPLILMTSLAFAGSLTETDEDAGCKFYSGTREGEVVPLKAECSWPVPASKVIAALDGWEGHDELFSAVDSSKILRTEGGASYVLQTHLAAGISDRQVLLKMKSSDVPGGKRFEWTIASDQQGNPGVGVMPAVDDGYWEVTDDGKGGAKVVHELRYLPGGSVPGFIVRWFQGSGFQALLTELKSSSGA